MHSTYSEATYHHNELKKTPTNIKKCHINEAKYFLNIIYTYQDFRLLRFVFHRATDCKIQLGSILMAYTYLLH